MIPFMFFSLQTNGSVYVVNYLDDLVCKYLYNIYPKFLNSPLKSQTHIFNFCRQHYTGPRKKAEKISLKY